MAELLRRLKISNGVMQEYVKTINVIFKQPQAKVIINLDSVVETKIINSKPFDTPILVVTYKGYNNFDYFSFLHLETAQELKQAIDEERKFVVLEEI
jgi:hypothetical protein